MNLVMLAGTIVNEPVPRDLAGGARLLSFDVATVTASGHRAQVPVAWFDPPLQPPSLAVGTEVVVTGEVRRRFFVTAGATASRTEVVADAVVPKRQAKKAAAAITQALTRAGEP
jgi:single-strand DNA-binding protein